jgi:hypothetical protein
MQPFEIKIVSKQGDNVQTIEYSILANNFLGAVSDMLNMHVPDEVSILELRVDGFNLLPYWEARKE